MSDSETSKMSMKVGVKKTLTLAHTISINRRHGDLEFLISRWSTESHTSLAAWGEFGPTLEDALLDNVASVHETHATNMVLDEK